MKLLISSLILLFAIGSVHSQPPTIISGIINSYAKVTTIDYCSRAIGVTSTAGFSIGDRAIIIQMKGAEIDTTNSPDFGTVTRYNEAGNFEFVTIESISTNSFRLKYLLVQDYNPEGAVQLVRVPRYITAWVQGAALTAPAWDGSTGGVLAFEASGAVDILSSIDMSGKGFRGGELNTGSIIQNNVPEYYSTLSSNRGGGKGESIADVDSLRSAARGALASGGGGGNQHNAGGGGGGNGGSGGMGGREYSTNTSGLINGGIGGRKLDFTGSYPKIFMGGGGGAGHQNNGVGSKGAAGGGIIIIKSGVLVGRGNIIAANGNTQTSNTTNDGAGGGGGGGTIFLDVERITSPVRVEARGGNGGNINTAQPHGPGGVCGGGSIAVNSTPLLDSIIPSMNGGNAGIILNTTNSYAAEAGQPGGNKIGQIIPEGNANPVVAQVAKDTAICPGSVALIGKSAFGGRKPYSYSWSPSLGLDNSSAEFPNASPPISTLYTVTVTDSTGCKSQAQVFVNLYEKQTISAGEDTAICLGSSVQIQAIGRGIIRWFPPLGLSNPSIANPIATPTETTTYHLIVTDSNGCSSEDSISIRVHPQPIVTLTSTDTAFCEGDSIVISASGISGTAPYSYRWSPNSGISDINSPTPIFSPNVTTPYTVVVTDASGCWSTAKLTIHVNPLPIADAGSDIPICYGDTTELSGKGAVNYSWSPAVGLSSTSISNPLASPRQTTTYYLTVVNSNGCTSTDSMRVVVHPLPQLPELTLATDTIISTTTTPVVQYTWFYEGLQIPSKHEPILIAEQSGKYTLTITDTNGCTSTSLPIEIILGNAMLAIENTCASPGEIATIPIRLLSAKSIAETRATLIELTMSFNASILLPLDQDFLENSVVNGERFVRLRIPITFNSNGLLRNLKFAVGLGNDTETAVKFTQYSSIGGRIYLTDSIGRFCVEGICKEGGVRLYRADAGNAKLTVASPQPIQNSAHIGITTVENGQTTLSLVNILGQRVATVLNEQLTSGKRSIEFDCALLNSGTYLLVLQTPTEYITQILYVQ